MKNTEKKIYIYRGIDSESYGRKYEFLSRDASGWNGGAVTLKDVETGARRSMGGMECSHFYDLEA